MVICAYFTNIGNVCEKSVNLKSEVFMSKLSMVPVFFAMSFSCLSFAAEVTPVHGYINSPPSRVYLCSAGAKGLNKGCLEASWDMQSLEGPKGFPQRGPVDGTIASAGMGGRFAVLNEQTPTRWYKVDRNSGKNVFNWYSTPGHGSTSWQFFITKPDWDPSSPLTRASFNFKPFCERYNNSQMSQKNVSIECNVPNRTGYHVILGVWTIDDTPNAVYQVIDVNMSGTTTSPSEVELNINNGNNVTADKINYTLAQADKVNIDLYNGHWASEIRLPQASQANKLKSVYIKTNADFNTTVYLNNSKILLTKGDNITLTSNGSTWVK